MELKRSTGRDCASPELRVNVIVQHLGTNNAPPHRLVISKTNGALSGSSEGNVKTSVHPGSRVSAADSRGFRSRELLLDESRSFHTTQKATWFGSNPQT
jgi:hypothetical protein